MSVPRIIILSPPPKRHSDAGSHTQEDCLPVAGRIVRPESEGTAIRRRRGTSASTSTMQSYLGLFRHASSKRLYDSMFTRNLWIEFLFERRGGKLRQRWGFPGKPADLRTQFGFFRCRFRGVILSSGENLQFIRAKMKFNNFDKDSPWEG